MVIVIAVTAPAASGLQISMLFLFQIIAGLLLADLFKQAIEVLNKSRAKVNVLLILAAAAFLLRLLVENFIFYGAPDAPPTNTGQYVLRIMMLLIDLSAFAIGYDIVHQISPAGLTGVTNVFAYRSARRVLWGMAAIEMLHVVWGLLNVALGSATGLSVHGILIGATSGTVAGRWLLLSILFAIAPLPVIRSIPHAAAPADLRAAMKVALFSAISVLAYLVVMRNYYIGNLR